MVAGVAGRGQKKKRTSPSWGILVATTQFYFWKPPCMLVPASASSKARVHSQTVLASGGGDTRADLPTPLYSQRIPTLLAVDRYHHSVSLLPADCAAGMLVLLPPHASSPRRPSLCLITFYNLLFLFYWLVYSLVPLLFPL